MPKTTTHPITEIQGIGSQTANKLKFYNVVYAEDLLSLPTTEMGEMLDPIEGLTKITLENNFIPQARFLRIEGIDGQYAEGLVASGYHTYRDLVNVDTNVIIGALSNRVEEGLIPKSPLEDEVISWQLAAARRVGTGFLHLTVFDAVTEERLEDVTTCINEIDLIHIAPVKRETNERGFVFYEYLAPGGHKVIITAEGYIRQAVPFTVEVDNPTQIRIKLKKGKHEPKIIDEFTNGAISEIKPQNSIEEKRVELEDLDPRPPALVHEIRKDTVLLSSIWRRKIDDEIEVYTFLMPKQELPTNLSPGNVLLPQDDGEYKLSDLTLLDYRKKFLFERLSARR